MGKHWYNRHGTVSSSGTIRPNEPLPFTSVTGGVKAPVTTVHPYGVSARELALSQRVGGSTPSLSRAGTGRVGLVQSLALQEQQKRDQKVIEEIQVSTAAALTRHDEKKLKKLIKQSRNRYGDEEEEEVAVNAHGYPVTQAWNEPPKVSAALVKRVVDAFDMDALRRRCMMTTDALLESLPVQYGAKGSRHAFLDRGGSILTVAHCDCVKYVSEHFVVAKLPKETLVFSPQLDDRLGVYTILDLLPRLGIVADVLFAENEETGQSTAKDFKPAKEYNWIGEFDRHGENAVCYQYTGMETKARPYFKIENGSGSDISKMGDLGIMAINVGVAYNNEHSDRCFCTMPAYLRQIARFLAFHARYAEEKLPYVKFTTPSYFSRDYDGYRGSAQCGARVYSYHLGVSGYWEDGIFHPNVVQAGNAAPNFIHGASNLPAVYRPPVTPESAPAQAALGTMIEVGSAEWAARKRDLEGAAPVEAKASETPPKPLVDMTIRSVARENGKPASWDRYDIAALSEGICPRCGGNVDPNVKFEGCIITGTCSTCRCAFASANGLGSDKDITVWSPSVAKAVEAPAEPKPETPEPTEPSKVVESPITTVDGRTAKWSEDEIAALEAGFCPWCGARVLGEIDGDALVIPEKCTECGKSFDPQLEVPRIP